MLESFVKLMVSIKDNDSRINPNVHPIKQKIEQHTHLNVKQKALR